MADRYRVLFISTHPVQYAAPIFRQMAQHPRLDIQVAYCSLQGAESAVDPEFGVRVKWDVPLLEGYPWVHVSNKSPWPGLGRFLGLINPGLWTMVTKGGYDAVVLYTGYACASFWIALAAAKLHCKAILFGTDAHELSPRDGKRWKVTVKRFFWPRLFRLANVVIVPSSGSAHLIKSLGIADNRTVVTPYVVDNEWWTNQAGNVDRAAVRRSWGVPEESPVVLCCAKLQPWKRPTDLLQAFATANVPDAHLVYAGDGPMRLELESQVAALGLADRVHFLGFTNQSQLPAVYGASDVLVLPSEYDAFGVVVNEAMLCGCSAVVSDRVGAGRDLVSNGEHGYVFPCRDIGRLSSILRDLLQDAPRLRRMGQAARRRMTTWSPRENIAALVQAVERAVEPAAKVLIYSHAFAPKVGGVETVVVSLAAGLARLDGSSGTATAQVTVATKTARDGYDDRALPFRVVRCPSLFSLVRLVRAADVVHVSGPAFVPLLVGLLLRKRVVVEHHGFQTVCPNGQLLHEPTQTACPGHFMAGRYRQCIRCNVGAGRLESLKLWLLTFPRRWLCTRTSSNVTPTEWLSALLRLPRVTTIHHGVAAEGRGELPAVLSPPVVAFVGRLVGTKGVDILLRATSRAKAEGLNFTLRIIGEGPERSRLAAQTRALGLADRVNFLGYQPDSGLRQALRGVGTLVMPSVGGEVFGLVAVENMMRGILPIVSDGGSLAEVVGDAGLTFPPGDDKALAACLARVLADPGLARTLREKARERASQSYREDQMIAEHAALYRELMADSSPSQVVEKSAP